MAQGEGDDDDDPEQDDEATDQVAGSDGFPLGDFAITIGKLVELAQELVVVMTNRIGLGVLVG